jgi:hypothetical protein
MGTDSGGPQAEALSYAGTTVGAPAARGAAESNPVR